MSLATEVESRSSSLGKLHRSGAGFHSQMYLEKSKNFIPRVDVVKLFFGGNVDFPKIKKLNKVCCYE